MVPGQRDGMATGATVHAELPALQRSVTLLRAEKDDLAWLRASSSSTLPARTVDFQHIEDAGVSALLDVAMQPIVPSWRQTRRGGGCADLDAADKGPQGPPTGVQT